MPSRPGDGTTACARKTHRLYNAGVSLEAFEGIFVSTKGKAMGDVGESFDCGRHVKQTQQVSSRSLSKIHYLSKGGRWKLLLNFQVAGFRLSNQIIDC